MNKHITLTLAALAALFVSTLTAGAEGEHSHAKKQPGPNGGRLIKSVTPNAEFFFTPERKVQITFVDKSGKAIAPAEQSVAVTTGERSAPVKLTFTKSGDTLLSDQAVPEGEKFPVVVQIKQTPDSKTVVERFTLDTSKCPECEMSEYACVCNHKH